MQYTLELKNENGEMIENWLITGEYSIRSQVPDFTEIQETIEFDQETKGKK